LKVCLINTYDLGHQPFGISSPASWLEDAGADVECLDLSIECIDEEALKSSGLIAIYLPMHTATMLAIEILPKIKNLNSDAHLSFYGLYASINKDFLYSLGGKSIISGEFEENLVKLYEELLGNKVVDNLGFVSLKKQNFRKPKRSYLPNLNLYAKLINSKSQSITVGYTESTRGCKHVCRHCPIVPVYNGRFFVVSSDVVMDDIRQQVEAGAKHITFGDPDFFNGPGHALKIIESFHEEFPKLTYDATIKVEHLLAHSEKLSLLAETGCLFITTAVEEVDDEVLIKLGKRHTRFDFVEVVKSSRDAGISLSPTFIPFHPWTKLSGFVELLSNISKLNLIENVASVQLGIRLLIPKGSRILDLKEINQFLGDFDEKKLSYSWKSEDPRVEVLQSKVLEAIQLGVSEGASRRKIFENVWILAHNACEKSVPELPPDLDEGYQIPAMSEPWYCCAEPTDALVASI
tara:strand:+ start:215 stop:1603 length:1389 start_codon:yes stop_codon:yes gene_type:complete